MANEPKQTRKTSKIILDSSALFVPLQFKIDIFEELKRLLNRNLQFFLLSPIQRELEELRERGSPKMRKNASYALKLAERCVFFEIDEKIAGSPDDAVVQMARKWNCSVFTNDKELRKRLRNINVPVIYVRQKSHLEIDGMI